MKVIIKSSWGIVRGPYASKKAALKSCVFATGYHYPEAKEHGWLIEKYEKPVKK